MKAGHYQSAVGARRRERRPAAKLAETSNRFCMRFRRKIGHIAFRERLAAERRRFDRKWLGRRGLLAGDFRGRHRPIFHWKKRPSSQAVEQEYKAGLGDLGHGFLLAAIARYCD